MNEIRITAITIYPIKSTVGQNLIPRTLGTVRVGDIVEVNDEET